MSPALHTRASTILAELGITEPSEIDIEAIAEFCGATILYEPLEGCEARILGGGDRAIITVGDRASRPRQRFSAAHELGHWMCDRGKIAFACDKEMLRHEWTADNPERRANRYAVDLLLPGLMFVPRAQGRDITFATVTDLAEAFQTSLTATAIRLVELGSFPAMIVCYDGARRRWFVRGPDVPGVLWPREDPGRNTLAYDLLREKPEVKGPFDVFASEWFELPLASRYQIREDSVEIAKGTVLTLLWWKDERQLLDLQEEEEA